MAIRGRGNGSEMDMRLFLLGGNLGEAEFVRRAHVLALEPEVIELGRHLRAFRGFKTNREVSGSVPGSLRLGDDAADRVGIAFGVENAGMGSFVVLRVAPGVFKIDVCRIVAGERLLLGLRDISKL